MKEKKRYDKKNTKYSNKNYYEKDYRRNEDSNSESRRLLVDKDDFPGVDNDYQPTLVTSPLGLTGTAPKVTPPVDVFQSSVNQNGLSYENNIKGWTPSFSTNNMFAYLKVFRFAFIDFSGKSDEEIINTMDPYHQRLYSVWDGEPSNFDHLFRFRRVDILHLNTESPVPNIENLTVAQFTDSPFYKEILNKIPTLSEQIPQSRKPDVYILLMPGARFTESEHASATTNSFSDPKRQATFYSLMTLGASASPTVFAHEFGHAMFTRKYTVNTPQGQYEYFFSINPYEDYEWNRLSSSDQALAQKDPYHSFTPGNIMVPGYIGVDSSSTASAIQQFRVYYSPLGYYRNRP